MNAVDPLQVIVDELSPELGPAMARASVGGIATRLGLVPPLAPADVDRLLDALAPGLAVFLGRAPADRTIAALRVRLREASGGTR